MKCSLRPIGAYAPVGSEAVVFEKAETLKS